MPTSVWIIIGIIILLLALYLVVAAIFLPIILTHCDNDDLIRTFFIQHYFNSKNKNE